MTKFGAAIAAQFSAIITTIPFLDNTITTNGWFAGINFSADGKAFRRQAACRCNSCFAADTFVTLYIGIAKAGAVAVLALSFRQIRCATDTEAAAVGYGFTTTYPGTIHIDIGLSVGSTLGADAAIINQGAAITGAGTIHTFIIVFYRGATNA